MIRPTLSEAKEYAKQGYHMVPVCYEMLSDIITPINLLKKLKAENEHCYILESVENQELWGRYTFLGYSPKLDITCMNGTLTLKDENGAVIKETSGIHPEIFIREVLKDYKSPKIEGFPTFTGGLVGYFSYDYLKYSEKKLVLDAKDEEGFQDVDLMLFDKVIAFDNVRSKLILIANADTANIEEGYQKALQDIKEMKELILHGAEADIPAPVLKTEFKPLFDKEAYCRMVEKAKHYIYEGDIFQVVLSNRLEAEMEGSLFDTYRLLRSTNPSPYMFYFDGDTIEVAGASPETLVKVEDGVLHTFPLAGTRPRGKTKVEDLELEKSLMADEKELAEHNMLVDLGRNDVGRVCDFGSVKVSDYKAIKRFSHVMHITSKVTGQLSADKDALDALRAVFPAGTLSGAPKIRACEIIDELEPERRGIYGGGMGYLDFGGNMDICITIRTMVKKNDRVYIQAGGGIVADSVLDNEFQETVNKAGACMAALCMTAEE